MDNVEIGARLTLIQNIVEHMLSGSLSQDPAGKEKLEMLQTSVMRSVTSESFFTRPLSDEEKEDHLVNVKTMGESLFQRTEDFRARLAAARK